MRTPSHHRIAHTDKLTDGLVLTFEDGRCALYSADLLYATLSQAEELVEAEEEEEGLITGDTHSRYRPSLSIHLCFGAMGTKWDRKASLPALDLSVICPHCKAKLEPSQQGYAKSGVALCKLCQGTWETHRGPATS